MQSVVPENVGLSSEKLGLVTAAMQANIDQGKLPGLVTMVARRGEIAYAQSFGYMDPNHKKPMRMDAIFRLASMTKPITSVAMLILIERGLIQLSDPITKFIPEFKGKKVFSGMEDGEMQFVEAEREFTIHDLMTYTTGMFSPFSEEPTLQKLDQGLLTNENLTWDEITKIVFDLPFEDQPGKRWRYGLDHLVNTLLIDRIFGKSFGEFLADEIFKPLEMNDTGFNFPQEKLDQITTAYDFSDPANPKVADAPEKRISPPNFERGDGNLLSSASDYMRFAQMLLNNGELNGKRIVNSESIKLMTTNHLPKDLLPYGIPTVNATFSGYGFGLGVGVLMDVSQTQTLGSVGEYGWPGAYTTYFWNDPSKELTGIFLSQVTPPQFWPHLVPPEFKNLVYQAILD